MRIFEKRWVRLLINIGISVALYFALIFSTTANDDVAGAVLGGVSFAGEILYFLAFDIFGDSTNKKVGLLRYVLVILGSVIILLFAFLSFIMVVGKKEFGSPWIEAFTTLWIMQGAGCFALNLLVSTKKLKEKRHCLYCFVPIASFVIAYVLGVIFCYLGIKVSGFFNFYFGLILGVLLIIAGILYIRKKGCIPFYGVMQRKEEQTERKTNRGKISAENNKNEIKKGDKENMDTRKDASAGLWYDTLEKAVRRAVERVRTGYYSGDYLKVDNIKFDWYVNKFGESINVNGTITNRLNSTLSSLTQSDLQDDAEDVAEQVKSALEEEIGDAVQECQNEYKGYDNDWNLCINLNYTIKG